MKDKQTFLMKGSFALLLFVILGYMVKFYPETLVGSLIVILSQRIKNPVWRKIVQIVLGLYLVSVLVSRVYLGVHYPSDVLASLCVGLGVLFIEFPFYDKLRFQWRFKGKQK